MEVGIVGLPGSGKSTLFEALTSGQSTAQGGGQIAARVGMAKVPDPRLEVIARFVKTQKIVPTMLRLVDIPGFAGGGESSSFARSVLTHVREVDAIGHVVRCFEAPGLAPAKPGRDIDAMETELILADLAVAEPSLERAAKAARSGDRSAKQRLAALEKVVPVLEDGRPVRAAELDEEEAKIVRGFGVITIKPVLYIANVAEEDIGRETPAVKAVAEHAEATGARSVALCAKVESEIAELDAADRQEMLESMGLEEPALSVMTRELQRLLGLTSFYTAGEKEIRAWAIPIGATAPEAAGAIHSDIQRGFIRAECYSVDDLVQHKSEKAIREAGKMRSEGKGYRMQDGDVTHFLFNI